MAQRTWSSRSAPRRDQRICCDLAMRRLTRKLAVPSVSDVPTRRPARCRSVVDQMGALASQVAVHRVQRPSQLASGLTLEGGQERADALEGDLRDSHI